MSLEIERRFRLAKAPPDDVLAAASSVKIVQSYIADTGGWIMRVRQTTPRVVSGEPESIPRHHLTMKRPVKGAAFASHEIEFEIGALTYARLLVNHTQGETIEKTRWTIPFGDLNWEFDMFSHPALRHLLILEIELPSEDHGINMPDWFEGVEITGDRAYSNYGLSQALEPRSLP